MYRWLCNQKNSRVEQIGCCHVKLRGKLRKCYPFSKHHSVIIYFSSLGTVSKVHRHQWRTRTSPSSFSFSFSREDPDQEPPRVHHGHARLHSCAVAGEAGGGAQRDPPLHGDRGGGGRAGLRDGEARGGQCGPIDVLLLNHGVFRGAGAGEDGIKKKIIINNELVSI